MAEDEKRYYWLQLKKDFFKRNDIQIIEGMPNGKDYILFYLKLLCESVDGKGNLRFNNEIPYNENMLSLVTHTNVDVVRSAVKVFTELKMMDILDDGTYYMREVEKMIGSVKQDEYTRESTRKRVEKHRKLQKQKQLEEANNRYSNVTDRYSNVTCNGELKIEIDKDIDIDIEKEKEKDLICADAQIQPTAKPKKQKPEKHKYGSFSNVLLTDDEYSKLKEQFSDADERIENLSFGIASKGYQYKNHYATILAWARNDDKRAIQQQKKQSRFIDYAEIGRQMDLERMRANEVVTI